MSLNSSVLCRNVNEIALRTNMRVHLRRYHNTHQFAKILLDIGGGEIEPDSNDGLIPVHKDLASVVHSENELIDEVFPNFSKDYKCVSSLSQRAILCPSNEVVRTINQLLWERLPSEDVLHKFIDTIAVADQAVHC